MLLPTLVWGLNFPFARISTSEFPPFLLLFLRFSSVSLLLIPFFPKCPPHFGYMILLTLLFGPLHAGGMIWSMFLEFSPSGAVLIQQFSIPISLCISVLFLKTAIHYRSILGLIISVLGLILLLRTPNILENLSGLMAISISAFSGGISLLLLKHRFHEVHPLRIIAWISLLSIPIMLCSTLLFEENQIQVLQNASSKAWLAAFYGFFISSVLGHGTWYYLLKKYPLDLISPITLLTPVFGVLGSMLILKESLSAIMVLGGLLTIIGTGIVVIRRPSLHVEE